MSAHSWALATAQRSAVVAGTVGVGESAMLAQGAVFRSADESIQLGAGSMVLENCVVVGWAEHPVEIGRRSVFGHRCLVVGASVGDLCEIGNGSILMPGARLGDKCFLGEGCLVPAGAQVPDGSVLVGRPARRLRVASPADLDRLRALRDGSLDLPPDSRRTVRERPDAGASMGQLYEYRGIRPTVHRSAVVFDTAEITGDVVIGPEAIIGSGVRIIGDSHGPVRIGSRVQILENTVLHLLPDNSLVLGDDVVIGPGCMIHGCHLGDGTVVEPGSIVCDGVHLGAGCHVGVGSLVPQRLQAGDRCALSGFPAVIVETDIDVTRPGWAIDPSTLSQLVRVVD